MHQKKLISKKSPKCSLIVRLSFTWQKHINAENGESNGYIDIYSVVDFLKLFFYKYTDICTFIRAWYYNKNIFYIKIYKNNIFYFKIYSSLAY